MLSYILEAVIIYLKDLIHLTQNNAVEFCRIFHLICSLGLHNLTAYIICSSRNPSRSCIKFNMAFRLSKKTYSLYFFMHWSLQKFIWLNSSETLPIIYIYILYNFTTSHCLWEAQDFWDLLDRNLMCNRDLFPVLRLWASSLESFEKKELL